MKKILLFLFLLPLFCHGQLMSYYSSPTTTTTAATWTPPAAWVDSAGVIDVTDGAALAFNRIKILVNTRTELSTYAFTVTCPNGYKVRWMKSGSWYNYSSAATAQFTYDTTLTQKYCVIEIAPQGTDSITAFTVAAHSLATQPQRPAYLWVAANYKGVSPIMGVVATVPNQGKLEAVWLSSVTSIGTSTFNTCYSLQSIVIPSSVTSIGTSAFQSCYSLQSIVIPSSVTSIGTSAFSGCLSLQSVVIPSSVTSIGTSAFQSCLSLQSVVIPSSVTSIGTSAFSTCYSLQSIVIPSSVTSIGTSAFQSCYGLANAVYTGTITTAESHDNLFTSTEQITKLNWAGLKTTHFDFLGASGKLNKLGSAGNIASDSIPIRIDWTNSTFSNTTTPQLNLSYNQMDTTQIQKIFKCLPTVGGAGSNTKQLTVVGCSGAATLSTWAVAIATNKGWQVLK
jgi:hypothetical protein